MTMQAKSIEPTPFWNEVEAYAGDGNVPAWLHEARTFGKERYADVGFPSTRREEFRFTNVAPIAQRRFHTGDFKSELSAAELAKLRAVSLRGPTVVFVNGLFSESLSTTDAGRDYRLAIFGETVDASPDGSAPILRQDFGTLHPFAFLNTALLRDGTRLSIGKGVRLDEPVQFVFVQTEAGVMSHPRIVIDLGEEAQADIVEEYVGSAAETFQNAVVQIRMAARSKLRHVRLQNEHPTAHHISNVFVEQAAESQYDSHSIAIGAALARTDHVVAMNGERAACTVDGLYLTDGRRHVDFHTTLEHNRPECVSRELFKGIVKDKSTAVFNGKVVVPPHSQLTDSEQGNHNLLLSRDALIHTKPELEIFADDVKCAHGATVGQLDETAQFYMRTRGIGKDDATKLLTFAFARDVVARIENEELREAISAAVEARLETGGQA